MYKKLPQLTKKTKQDEDAISGTALAAAVAIILLSVIAVGADGRLAAVLGANTRANGPETTSHTQVITEETTIPFGQIAQESDDLQTGERVQKRPGTAGRMLRTYSTTLIDGVETDKELIKEEVIEQPVDAVFIVGSE